SSLNVLTGPSVTNPPWIDSAIRRKQNYRMRGYGHSTGIPALFSADRREVRRVAVILAGSRTGSSFLFRALSSLGGFLAPLGEETPFYRQGGLGWVRSTGDSDRIEVPPPEDV